jgi:hypothetical protein
VEAEAGAGVEEGEGIGRSMDKKTWAFFWAAGLLDMDLILAC